MSRIEQWGKAMVDIAREEALIRVALHREHAAIVRAVKRLQKEEHVEGASVVGYRVALRQVLTLLAGRKGRKGKTK